MATDSGSPGASGVSPGSTARRTRRSPHEVRELLLGAARSTFAARGYARSSTRDIAFTAGVSRSDERRDGGARSTLFELAILDPFQGFMNDYVDGRPADRTDHPAPPEVPS